MFILDSNAAPFTPISFLQRLREACLARSETRLPTWRFRVAPEFLVQIQPRPPTEVQAGVCVLFRGIAVAIERGTATAAMLTQSQFVFKDLWVRRHFELVQHVDDKRWFLNRRGGFHHRRAGRLSNLDRRLARIFTGDFFREDLTPESMLGENCLICGAALSDPVSMGRKIGPECFGSSSNVMPCVLAKRRRRS